MQSIAEILAEAAFAAGKQALYIPSFGVEQRGGVSLAFVQIGEEPVSAPKFATSDMVGVLSSRSVSRVRQYVAPESLLLYDSSLEEEVKKVYGPGQRSVSVPALKLAEEELHPRVFNVIILGVLLSLINFLPLERVKEALERHLGHRFAQDPVLRELNYRALDLGRQYGDVRERR
ncbi:MAG: hypothetical protein PWP65_111 [Clostridia bacterium]|nr:hypothetical protein [Clostridia bacterium]